VPAAARSAEESGSFAVDSNEAFDRRPAPRARRRGRNRVRILGRRAVWPSARRGDHDRRRRRGAGSARGRVSPLRRPARPLPDCSTSSCGFQDASCSERRTRPGAPPKERLAASSKACSSWRTVSSKLLLALERGSLKPIGGYVVLSLHAREPDPGDLAEARRADPRQLLLSTRHVNWCGSCARRRGLAWRDQRPSARPGAGSPLLTGGGRFGAPRQGSSHSQTRQRAGTPRERIEAAARDRRWRGRRPTRGVQTEVAVSSAPGR